MIGLNFASLKKRPIRIGQFNLIIILFLKYRKIKPVKVDMIYCLVYLKNFFLTPTQIILIGNTWRLSKLTWFIALFIWGPTRLHNFNAHANILKWKHLAVVEVDMIYYFLFENLLDQKFIINAPAIYFNFIKFLK